MRASTRLLPFALLAGIVLPASDALAQFARGPGRPARDAAAPNRPPPPALPGLQNRTAPEPIPADPNQVLSPNASLFDAINRGDLPAAKDAMARGADLDSRNVLGLTPVDAAVDQGRTEIMFYLLSVRGGTRVAGRPPEAEGAAAGKAVKARAARGGNGPRPAAEAIDRSVPVVRPTARNPRLWAGDGGAAKPEIGFLGFDAGRPAVAMPVSTTSVPQQGRAAAGRRRG